MNVVLLSGNVGRDPESRSIPGKDGNFTVASFPLATKDGYGDKEKTNWHNIEVLGKKADVIVKYVKKGTFLIIKGQLELQTWEKDNVKQYKVVVKMQDFDFGPKQEAQAPQPAAQPVESKPEPEAKAPVDDDLPF